MKILAISGSLRRASWSTKLARAAAGLVPDEAELEVYENLAAIPNFDEDVENEGVPEAVQHLREAIAAADAVLWVTPEYNAQVSGALKNALDWASRPHGSSSLTGKPVAVMSSSPLPFGAVWANEQLRRGLGIPGARVSEVEVALGKIDEKFDGEKLTDEGTREKVREQLADLAGLVYAAREEETVAA